MNNSILKPKTKNQKPKIKKLKILVHITIIKLISLENVKHFT